ncbi:MAG: hypothetical protein WAV10_02080 [Minisyncoccia bacterium]
METPVLIELDKKDKTIASSFLWGTFLFLVAIAFCNAIPKTYAYVVVPIFGAVGVFLLLRACWFIKKSS